MEAADKMIIKNEGEYPLYNQGGRNEVPTPVILPMEYTSSIRDRLLLCIDCR